MTAEFFLLNNSSTWVSQGTKALTNGEATLQNVDARPGRNYWYAVVTDDHGAATTSDTATFQTPGLLRVRYASNLSLLDHTAVRAHIDGAAIQPENRVVSNGIVDLQNLPNETLRINVSADGYQNRSLVVEAPAKTYDTALVPTSDGTSGDGPTPDVQTADLFGVVKTDRDHRVGGAVVTVENRTTSWTTTTNATGWYAFGQQALAAGDYNVTVTSSNQSLETASGTVTLGATRTRLNVTLATADAPVLFPDRASPTGPTAARDVTLEIPVADAEFGTAAGDTVTVEFFVDGTSVGTDTLSSAGIASTTTTLPTNATVTWSVTATDSYTAASSASFTVRTAGELVLRNESEPTQNLSNLANASVTYYGQSTAETRSITDETLNLTGVPTGAPTVASIQADGFYTREIALFNLSQQGTAYLLPKSADASTVVFQLQDYTGAFRKGNASLIVKRPLPLNGSTTYRTVTSRPFGATGEYATELETGIRYRLLIRNEAGETRRLGSYTPRADSVQVVTVSPSGELDLVGRGIDVGIRPQVGVLPAKDRTITVRLGATDATLRNASILVRAFNDTTGASNLLAKRDVFATGQYEVDARLDDRGGQRLVVTVWYTTAAGVTDSVTKEFRIRPLWQNDYSLLSTVGGFQQSLPERDRAPFGAAVALFGTVVLTAASARTIRASSEVHATVALLSLAGFAVIGFVDYGLVFVGAVGALVFSAYNRGAI
jgi:hypothetical protein